MSRRVTTQSEMTDRDVLAKAFERCGVQAKSTSPTSFEIRAGGSVGFLNTNTGEISGDSDHFREKDFDNLRMHYTAEKYLWELARTGASVHSYETDRQGNIVIQYQTA